MNALVKDFVGGEPSIGLAVRDFSWGSLRNSFHRLKRRINPHQSNRSRATNDLVHKSEVDIHTVGQKFVKIGLSNQREQATATVVLGVETFFLSQYVIFGCSIIFEYRQYLDNLDVERSRPLSTIGCRMPIYSRPAMRRRITPRSTRR